MLSLLQIKMEAIRKLEQEHSKTARNNDSTLEMTQLADSNFREANEVFANERALLKNRVSSLEEAVTAKHEEMGRLRDYYTGII